MSPLPHTGCRPGHSRYQFWHRSGSTRLVSQAPVSFPGKREANVTSKGQTFIDAKFQGFVPANSFGVEYLTYVLWAITPQGRPVNLGEVMPGGSKAEMNVTPICNNLP